MKNLNHILIIALTGTLLASCGTRPETGQEAAAEPAENTAKPVKVMPLNYAETSESKKLTATVVPFEETYLSPALQGRIRSVKVEVNDHVQKGDLLVEMDGTQLEQTRLQYKTLKTDLARMDTLLKSGSVTQQAYDQMESQVETTGLVLENLEENTLLRAPYTGVITGKYYNDGELFSPTPNTPAGKAALVSMVQLDPVKVIVNLSEKYLPLVRTGMDATISTEVYPGLEFTGNVFRIHPTVSPATRTFAAEIRIPNAGRKLRPGMFARVALRLGDKEALLVPSVAVLQQTGTNQRYVMVHENGMAKRVVVNIADRHNDLLEIESPDLKGGEQLIIAGQTGLEEGDAVKVVTD